MVVCVNGVVIYDFGIDWVMLVCILFVDVLVMLVEVVICVILGVGLVVEWIGECVYDMVIF